MKEKSFDWTKGQGAQLIRSIAEDSTCSALEADTIDLALKLKEHWWKIKRNAPAPYGWDQDVINDFAAAFGLKPAFENGGIRVVLTKKP